MVHHGDWQGATAATATATHGRTRKDVASLAEFERTFEEVKNWGRWGWDDRLGTLNYLTPAGTAAAAALVTTGHVISMAWPIDTVIGPDNPRPSVHTMHQSHEQPLPIGDVRFAMDALSGEIHGNSHSHIDALSHVSYRGQLYNGMPAASVAEGGPHSLDITSYARGIVGRGVLLDIPLIREVEWLEPGDAVTAEELERAERILGVRVGEGDMLVFRTGHGRRRAVLGAWDSSPLGDGKAGLAIDAVRWMHDRRIAAFLPDGDGETIPVPVEGVLAPIHALQIVAMGLAAADSLDLEALASACRRAQRYHFLVMMSPLSLPGGTGSLVNPLAVF